MDNEFAVVLSTVDNSDTAERIASALVEERLAACVNIVPAITSVYRWKGEIARASECLLIIKTAAPRVEALTARLRALHPYEVPEIVVVPIAGGLDAYLSWIRESTA